MARTRGTESWWRSLAPVLAATDVLAVLVCGVTTVLLVGWGDRSDLGDELASVVVVAALVGVFAGAAGLQRARLTLRLLPDLPGLLTTAIVADLVTLLAGRVTGSTLLPSGAAAATYLLATLLVLVLARAAVYAGTDLARRFGLTGARVVVVGTGPVGRRLVRALLDHPGYGLVPVGFVEPGPPTARRGLPLPLLGSVDTLPRALAESGATRVLLALPEPPDDTERAAVDACLAAGVVVQAAPRYVELTAGRSQGVREVVDAIRVVRILSRQPSWWVRLSAASAGTVVAFVTLVLVAPLAALAAVLVRLETGPGVVVRQPEVDDSGHTVGVPKFRTRRAAPVVGADTEWQVAGRAGPVGRALRRTRLDELPQVVATSVDRLRLPLRPARGPGRAEVGRSLVSAGGDQPR